MTKLVKLLGLRAALIAVVLAMAGLVVAGKPAVKAVTETAAAKEWAGWCCGACGFCNHPEAIFCYCCTSDLYEVGILGECTWENNDPGKFCVGCGCDDAAQSVKNGGIDKRELTNADSSAYPTP